MNVKMICNSSFGKKFLNEQSGQALVWVILGSLSIFGVAGLVIDGGQAYADHAILQNSANAAALAAAGVAYDTGSDAIAITTGRKYSGAPGDSNLNTNMPGAGSVTTNIVPVCIASLLPTGSTCAQQTSGFVNAVHAYQTNTVNTFFMRIFGIRTLSISAEATATMLGAAQNWNVAIIVDGTQSMGTTDTNCGTAGTYSEFQCALAGVQQLLGGINPCPGAGTGCIVAGTNAAGTPLFRVAMFTFPNINSSGYNPTNANLSSCYNYTGKNEPYTFPGASATPGTGNITPATPTSSTVTTNFDYPLVGSPQATYQITSFDYQYYDTSSTNGHLNTSDNLVRTVGYGATPLGSGSNGTTACLPNVGGEGTYYAGVIYAAQEALLYEQTKYPGSQNAMILLSDGDATETSGDGHLDSGTTAGSKLSTSTTYPYPSYFDQCQQAIQAGQIAANQGTRVVAIAYGAENSGCGLSGTGQTDTTVLTSSALPNKVNVSYTVGSKGTLLPCVDLENIADNLTDFYADPNQSGTGVNTTCGTGTTNAAISNIQQIFNAISASFTNPKLISNSAI